MLTNALQNYEPDDELKQKLAREFNLSETTFLDPLDSDDYSAAKKFNLRWFTPTNEVPLCGHATLATAHVLFNELGNENDKLEFQTLSGILTVACAEVGSRKHALAMNFPLAKVYTLNSWQATLGGDKFERVGRVTFYFANTIVLDGR